MNIADITLSVAYLVLLVYASVIDYRKCIIYDRTQLMLIILAILACRCNGRIFLLNMFGAIFISLPFLTIALKTNQLGGGDVKFIFTNCLLLGFKGGYSGIVIGLSVIIVTYIVKWRREDKGKKAIPMAPFLSVGFGAIYLLRLIGFR